MDLWVAPVDALSEATPVTRLPAVSSLGKDGATTAAGSFHLRMRTGTKTIAFMSLIPSAAMSEMVPICCRWSHKSLLLSPDLPGKELPSASMNAIPVGAMYDRPWELNIKRPARVMAGLTSVARRADPISFGWSCGPS
jgi:hypothetical protein